MAAPANIGTESQKLIALLDEATDVLTSFVVPLYEDNDGRPSLFGSGFFVRSGVDHFLVSAAHVLEALRGRPLFYYITPTTTRKLSGQLRLNRWNGDRNSDPIDIGVLRLTESSPHILK